MTENGEHLYQAISNSNVVWCVYELEFIRRKLNGLYSIDWHKMAIIIDWYDLSDEKIIESGEIARINEQARRS